MKKLICFRILFYMSFLFMTIHAEAQEIKWQNTMGGSMTDMMTSFAQTLDGGFICGGWSYSPVSGDKSEPAHNRDYWIIKLDERGNIRWEQTLWGSGNDELESVSQTADGGYILGGSSDSPLSGDKTENSQGWSDYWIIKLDAEGTTQWQNSIGGSSHDHLSAVYQTQDGGYICGGYSSSQISGDKTENSISNSYDFWVLKLDKAGNILWQNTFGGSMEDKLFAVYPVLDGGYICGGTSKSGISGDKTSPTYGYRDYWVVKLDSSGNLIWENTFGGTGEDILESVCVTRDGGYVLGGHSGSPISGNKTTICNGISDFWIIKLDANGTTQWQVSVDGGIGGVDPLYSVIETIDGGILCGGYTNEVCPVSTGPWDFMLAKLKKNGTLDWKRIIGAPHNDYITTVAQSWNEDFVCGGQSASDSACEKTENCKGGLDYWIMQLTNNYNRITGTVYADLNANLTQDPGEPPIPGKMVKETGTGRFSFTNTVGKYMLPVVDIGNYSVTAAISTNNIFLPSPDSNSAYFATMNLQDSLNDFGFQPSGVYNDLCVSIVPSGPFRSGFNAGYIINYGNYGSTTLGGTVIFYTDSNITFVSSNLTPASISADSIVWNTGLLTPFQMGSITVTVLVHPGLPIGTLIYPTVHIDPVIGDAVPQCNDDSWEVYTVGSYDPNDIIVNEETITSVQLTSLPYLEYIIRFQNTGNDTAFFVKIANPIDTSKLVISTLEFVSSSHPASLNWSVVMQKADFVFDTILLPDSSVNEPMSHGFVRYRIKPKSNLNAGDSIRNHAFIYFDYNDGVMTNYAVTKIIFPGGMEEQIHKKSHLKVYPNPVSDHVVIATDALSGNETAALKIFDLFGREIYKSPIINKPSITLNVSGFANGIYVVQLETGKQLLRAKFVKQ